MEVTTVDQLEAIAGLPTGLATRALSAEGPNALAPPRATTALRMTRRRGPSGRPTHA